MPLDVQQAIITFLGAVAAIMAAVGGVFAAYYRVRSNASADNAKKQGNAAEAHGQALDNTAEALLILAKNDEKNTTDISLLAENQQRNIKTHEATVEIMKSLNDRNTLLEDLVADLHKALALNTAALAESAQTNTQLIDLNIASSRQFGEAMNRMSGAGIGIIGSVNENTDKRTGQIAVMLQAVVTETTSAREMLERLHKKVDNLMTETALKDLIAQLEDLATAVADIRPVVVSFLAQITTLQTITDLESDKKKLQDAVNDLSSQLVALKAKYEPGAVDQLKAENIELKQRIDGQAQTIQEQIVDPLSVTHAASEPPVVRADQDAPTI